MGHVRIPLKRKLARIGMIILASVFGSVLLGLFCYASIMGGI